MTLTAEQIDALNKGKPVPLTPPELGKECVLLCADAYERIKNLIYDDSEMDPREAYPAVLRAWDEEGCPADAELYQP